MKRFFLFILIFCFIFNNFILGQQAENNKLSQKSGISSTIITSDGAWCWFSDPRAVHYKDKSDCTYIGWVNSNGDIMIGSIDQVNGEIRQYTLLKALQKDDHDNPSILIRPDGRLLVFFSRHSGYIYSVLSKLPENINEWEEVQKIEKFEKNSCYTNPIQLSDENNRIYLFWRGSDWQPTFAFSDDGGKSWSDPKAFIKAAGLNSNQRPYLKVASNNKNRIDFAFTDGHPRDEAQNSIYHMYYRKGTFYETDGKKICSIDQLPVEHAKLRKVYDGTKTIVRSWIWDVCTDSKLNPVIVYTRLPEETDHRYHYARWNGKAWIDTELCKAGKWFPQTEAGQKEREPHYSAGIVIDHSKPSIVYLSRPVNEIFEIERWETSDHGKTWNNNPVTSNSLTSNVRPFVVRNYNNNGPQVLWMNIFHHYNHYTDFLTEIKFNKKGNHLLKEK